VLLLHLPAPRLDPRSVWLAGGFALNKVLSSSRLLLFPPFFLSGFLLQLGFSGIGAHRIINTCAVPRPQQHPLNFLFPPSNSRRGNPSFFSSIGWASYLPGFGFASTVLLPRFLHERRHLFNSLSPLPLLFL